MLVKGACGGDRVLKAGEKVWCRIRVLIAHVGQPLEVVTDLGHLRIEIGQDVVAVEDGLPELLTQPVQRLRRCGQGLIQLYWINLFPRSR